VTPTDAMHIQSWVPVLLSVLALLTLVGEAWQ
jgi:hypothetical protein